MPRTGTTTVLALALVLAGCASASDRFEEGLEAEAYGQYYEAAMRYVEALEKDHELPSARDRLMISGDSAIAQGMQGAERRLSIGDAVGAGSEYLALDRLIGAARTVGVRLPAPEDYGDVRRWTFDEAIDELMETAASVQERGQWPTARSAYARIRSDFQPDREQRRASLDAESYMFLAWAQSEERGMRFRSAFGHAASALAVSGGAPGDVVEVATALQDRAVEAGTRFVAVFPVTMDPELLGIAESDPAFQLADILELEHWRAPPVFVMVADPILVRQLTRRYTPPGAPLRPRRILEEVGADFGALIEITRLTVIPRNVRQRVRTAQTSSGGTVRYTQEEGMLHYDIRAQVRILDEFGRTMDNFGVSESESGPFERAVYDGDPRDLDLSRSERMLFDPVREAQARRVIEDRLIGMLAEELAGSLFQRVLRRIP